jgi:Uma2 family endonuclease
MKSMRRAKVRFNYTDYLLLPEDKRYEILDGELCVVPAPNIRHQRISRTLLVALTQHASEMGLGEFFHAPCDVVLSDETIVQPDLLFVREERVGIIGASNLQGAPDLVLEILSIGTRSRDLEIKRKFYAGFGIQEYWIVDPEADTVEVLVWNETGYVSAAVFGKSDRLFSPLLPELNLALVEIFED